MNSQRNNTKFSERKSGMKTLKEFENKMYELANSLVGNIGDSTDSKLSVTNEEYIGYVYIATDENEILPAWKKWIEAYITFIPSRFIGYTNYFFAPLYLYWRTKPEIITKVTGLYQCYARLLITNLTKEVDYLNPYEKESLRQHCSKDAYELSALAYQEHLKWCHPYNRPKDHDKFQG